MKARFRRFNEEVYTKGNMNGWDELFSPDYVEHTYAFGDVGPLKVVKETPAKLKSGASDYRATIDELIVEGDAETLAGDRKIPQTEFKRLLLEAPKYIIESSSGHGKW